MDDDIVIRLRKWARRIESWQFESDTTSELREAADEIERLREQLAISKHECQMADDAVQDLQTRLIKAVRNGL